MEDVFKLENTFSKLPEQFYQLNEPTKVTDPELCVFNDELASFLGLKLDIKNQKHKEELSEILSGNKILKNSKPLSAVYSGHQFGHFSPILGDGRAHLLGEIRGLDKKLYDLQLKGSGVSAFSRSGDGRSPLGPVLREYIISEAMSKLSVPTTRSLAVVQSGESVYREKVFKGAILTRLSLSHIRVGTFEYFASTGDKKNLEELLNYVVNREFLELAESKNKVIDFFKAVMEKQIQLVAKWMSLGFIHGVMNTDNTSISGLTIDYGPCAFMDETDFDKVFSFIDRNGRYSYSNQPIILKWNLARLAEALLVLFPEESMKEKIPLFMDEIDKFDKLYEDEWQKVMFKKLGFSFKENNLEKRKILDFFLNYLETNKVDFTKGFQSLGGILMDENADHDLYKDEENFKVFFKDWKNLLHKDNQSNFKLVAKKINAVNPIYIPRNHLVEEAVQHAYEGDFSFSKKIIKILNTPYTKLANQVDHQRYSSEPKREEEVKNTFCGT